MTRFAFIPVCIVAALVACRAGAETDSAASTPPAPGPYERVQPADPEDQVVCKRETVTGSMIPARICKTKRAIRQEKEASQRTMSDLGRSGGFKRGPVDPVTGDN